MPIGQLKYFCSSIVTNHSTIKFLREVSYRDELAREDWNHLVRVCSAKNRTDVRKYIVIIETHSDIVQERSLVEISKLHHVIGGLQV